MQAFERTRHTSPDSEGSTTVLEEENLALKKQVRKLTEQVQLPTTSLQARGAASSTESSAEWQKGSGTRANQTWRKSTLGMARSVLSVESRFHTKRDTRKHPRTSKLVGQRWRIASTSKRLLDRELIPGEAHWQIGLVEEAIRGLKATVTATVLEHPDKGAHECLARAVPHLTPGKMSGDTHHCTTLWKSDGSSGPLPQMPGAPRPGACVWLSRAGRTDESRPDTAETSRRKRGSISRTTRLAPDPMDCFVESSRSYTRGSIIGHLN